MRIYIRRLAPVRSWRNDKINRFAKYTDNKQRSGSKCKRPHQRPNYGPVRPRGIPPPRPLIREGKSTSGEGKNDRRKRTPNPNPTKIPTESITNQKKQTQKKVLPKSK